MITTPQCVLHGYSVNGNTWSGENVGETNNNGLGYTVEVLEHIYTDPEFPKDLAPTLSVSLKASGKSRADLWALATIAAGEHSHMTPYVLGVFLIYLKVSKFQKQIIFSKLLPKNKPNSLSWRSLNQG